MSSLPPVILDFPANLPSDATHHLVRAELPGKRPRRLHGHHFHELLWVQNGTLRHRLAEGYEDLQEGDLVFLSPGQSHSLQARAPATIVVSLSIRTPVIAAIGTRFAQLSGRAFWADRPQRLHRDIRQLAALNQAALRLERSPNTALSLEAFLLPLLSDLAEGAQDLSADLPLWLRAACQAARDPQVFREGAAGLVRLSGRAHPHVARSMRRYLDQTPSEYMNTLRMAHAARRLLASEDSLAEIATDCGLPNLSHFHKLFAAHHGETPQRFRAARRSQLLQP